MATNLQKGQCVDIGLQKVGVGLGWQTDDNTGLEYDLNASAFMLGDNSKLPEDEFFVYYNNLCSQDGAVVSSGDDLTGASTGAGDDETITVDLSKVDPRVTAILFTATIHDAENRRQHFGQVHSSYIRIYDTVTEEEIARYNLDEDLSIATAIEFGRLRRHGGQWKFEAIGNGFKGGLLHLANKYI